jgi:hypothetical protein
MDPCKFSRLAADPILHVLEQPHIGTENVVGGKDVLESGQDFAVAAHLPGALGHI